jgi:exosortase/archaeosortase family protein
MPFAAKRQPQGVVRCRQIGFQRNGTLERGSCFLSVTEPSMCFSEVRKERGLVGEARHGLLEEVDCGGIATGLQHDRAEQVNCDGVIRSEGEYLPIPFFRANQVVVPMVLHGAIDLLLEGDTATGHAPDPYHAPVRAITFRLIRDRWETNRSFRFAVSYAGLCAAFFIAYFVYTFPYSGLPYRIFTEYLRLYACAAGAVLHIFDPTVSVSGSTIAGRASLAIVRGCDGTEVLILFTSAVLASSIYPWKLRALGVVAGAAVLLVANVVRICCLYYVSARWPAAMDTWHFEIWPLILITTALGLFLGWMRWAAERTRARAS